MSNIRHSQVISWCLMDGSLFMEKRWGRKKEGAVKATSDWLEGGGGGGATIFYKKV